jgi:hypothetical protein
VTSFEHCDSATNRLDKPEKSLQEKQPVSSDVELNQIGVLVRREIEARILAPIIEALGNEFGQKEVLEITRK